MRVRSPTAITLAALSLRLMVPLAALTIAFAPTSAIAHDYTLGELRIGHPYARPTPPGARTGGAYFTIRNVGKAGDRLLRVSSSAAQTVELHSMTMDGNLMKMRAVPALDIPAGSNVTLGTGGYHVMLTGLRQPLVAGNKLPLTLTFEKAGTIEVSAQVEAFDASADADTSAAGRH
ncbi:MAG: copper chaperone PCu(A)C [Casimicrobiaceae bacterium]